MSRETDRHYWQRLAKKSANGSQIGTEPVVPIVFEAEFVNIVHEKDDLPILRVPRKGARGAKVNEGRRDVGL